MTQKEFLKDYTPDELHQAYQALGLDEMYYELFKSEYNRMFKNLCDEYNAYEYNEDEEAEGEDEPLRETTLKFQSKQSVLYSRLRNNGHCHDWAYYIARFGTSETDEDYELSFKDASEKSVYDTYWEFQSKDEEMALNELYIHCSIMGWDKLYTAVYVEYVTEMCQITPEDCKFFCDTVKRQMETGKSEKYSITYANTLLQRHLADKDNNATLYSEAVAKEFCEISDPDDHVFSKSFDSKIYEAYHYGETFLYCYAYLKKSGYDVMHAKEMAEQYAHEYEKQIQGKPSERDDWKIYDFVQGKLILERKD